MGGALVTNRKMAMEAERIVDMGSKTMAEGSGCSDVDFPALPEGVIAYILSLTSTRDVCRSALVSRIFCSASQSDSVWDKFLPSDYDWRFIRSRSDPNDLNFYDASSSKKNLFFKLCDSPLLIDRGKKSFQLDKDSGKKCLMLGARGLVIIWSSTPTYWTWKHLPDARFPEVAELLLVWWFEIRATINAALLSEDTRYGAYFVFKMKNHMGYGFNADPLEVKMKINGCENQSLSVCLETDRRKFEHGLHQRWNSHEDRMVGLPGPSQRDDGWWEIGLGEFYREDENDVFEISMMATNGHAAKGGLIVHGIEIRPKG